MDANKLKVLKSCGYVINKNCGTCRHGTFSHAGAQYGTCATKTYEHEKHVGEPRQLSVFVHGVCEDDFEMDEVLKACLDSNQWGQFVDTREFTRSNRGKIEDKKVRY